MPANMRKMLNFSVMLLATSVAGCGAATTVNQPPPPPQASSCSSLSPGQGASLGGFVPFPADSLWNAAISSAPVDPNSAAVINFIGAGTSMHADFGAGPVSWFAPSAPPPPFLREPTVPRPTADAP